MLSQPLNCKVLSLFYYFSTHDCCRIIRCAYYQGALGNVGVGERCPDVVKARCVSQDFIDKAFLVFISFLKILRSRVRITVFKERIGQRNHYLEGCF